MISAVADWRLRLAGRVFREFQSSNWAVPTARAIGAGANQLQAAFLALSAMFSIDPITNDPSSPAFGVGRGVLLDRIGRLVGQPRGAAMDDVYRQLLRARVVANKASGVPDPVIDTFLAFFGGLGAPRITPGWIAQFTLRLVGVALDPLALQAALGLLAATTQAGTRSVLEWVTTTEDRVLICDALGPHQGWGDATDPTVGGLMAGAAAAT